MHGHCADSQVCSRHGHCADSQVCSMHGHCADSQVCSLNLRLDSALHCTVLFVKGSAGNLYRRTKSVRTYGDDEDMRALCAVLRLSWCRQHTALPNVAGLTLGAVGTAKC
jgi:hypothetical protein